MTICCVGPWTFVKSLAWLMNRWQRLCSGLSQGYFYASDAMDKYMPTVRGRDKGA